MSSAVEERLPNNFIGFLAEEHDGTQEEKNQFVQRISSLTVSNGQTCMTRKSLLRIGGTLNLIYPKPLKIYWLKIGRFPNVSLPGYDYCC
jgi:hypothetical protein